MSKYAIGLDYGTNSVRSVIVDTTNGRELGSAVFNYPHGDMGVVIDPKDPNGPYTLKKGEQLGLRHRFILHDGSFGVEEIEQAYQRYAASPQ